MLFHCQGGFTWLESGSPGGVTQPHIATRSYRVIHQHCSRVCGCQGSEGVTGSGDVSPGDRGTAGIRLPCCNCHCSSIGQASHMAKPCTNGQVGRYAPPPGGRASSHTWGESSWPRGHFAPQLPLSFSSLLLTCQNAWSSVQWPPTVRVCVCCFLMTPNFVNTLNVKMTVFTIFKLRGIKCSYIVVQPSPPSDPRTLSSKLTFCPHWTPAPTRLPPPLPTLTLAVP